MSSHTADTTVEAVRAQHEQGMPVNHRRHTSQRHTSQRPHEYSDVRGTDSNVHRIELPQCDIDTSIHFSWIRCLFAISGLLLAASDIPRSGYGTRHFADDFKQVMPDTFVYFGPYAYPSVQIYRVANDTAFVDASGPAATQATTVWAYKHDSLSLPLRAIAQSLNVVEYPRCLQYKSKCASKYLDLGTTFVMLDALVTALYTQHFQLSEHQRRHGRDTIYTPYVLQTRNYWIDRLRHIVLDKFGWHRLDTRLYSMHYYRRSGRNSSSSLELCRLDVPRTYRPAFCTVLIAWDLPVTLPSSSGGTTRTSTTSSIDQHIARRLAHLEQQHPHLTFDLTILSTLQASSNRAWLQRPIPIASATYGRGENDEVVTLIRGRLCVATAANATTSSKSSQYCATHVVDDFRYERALLHTNASDWFATVRWLRAAAQGYVWLRIACLWLGCYAARCTERKFIAASMPQRLAWTATTVFKVPSHVVVYGSWPPIVLYVLAHAIDCGVVHLLCERLWATLNGTADGFDFVAYVTAASIQMRNAWLVALIIKTFFVLVPQLLQRPTSWKLRDGVVGVRGGLVSMLSTITLFSYLRSNRFRSTVILDVVALTPQALRMDQQSIAQQAFESPIEFGLGFDLRGILVSLVPVLSVALAIKLYCVWCPQWWALQQRERHRASYDFIRERAFATNVLFSRQHCLPYSIGTLVPLTALCLFWHMTVVPHAFAECVHQRQRAPPLGKITKNKVAVLESVNGSFMVPTTRRTWHLASLYERLTGIRPQCHACARRKSSAVATMQKLVVPLHASAFFEPERRTSASWASVQLLNIALLTEPLALFQLIVTGRTLYVYRVILTPRRHQSHQSNQAPTDGMESSAHQRPPLLLLLPCDPHTLARNAVNATGNDATQYELVDTVNSTSVSWRHLTLCG